VAASAHAPGRDVRLADLMAALSLATDLADGFPPETALKTCLVSLGIAQELGLRGSDLSNVYYVALLHNLGCTATAHEVAKAVGDDVAFRQTFVGLDEADMLRATRSWLSGAEKMRRLRGTAGYLLHGRQDMRQGAVANCEVSTRLAGSLGLDEGVLNGLKNFFERWDGKGIPSGVSGAQIPLASGVARLGHMAVHHLRRGGNVRSLRAKLRRWAGTWVDPSLAAAFLNRADELVEAVTGDSVWDSVLAAEPDPRPWVPPSRRAQVVNAFAYFADLKSTLTLGHSSGVAAIALAAGSAAGLDQNQQGVLHEAGLLHDLGRVGIPNSIWEKPGSLTAAERERVRLHPYHTERTLASSPVLEPLARLAGSDHERLDGSGYHRGIPAALLSTEARILAAADSYQAMLEARPHRPAFTPEQAGYELRREVEAGRLDRRAVGCVLAASGQQHRHPQPQWPAGLTDREVDVLRLLARGDHNRSIAKTLFISEETVHNHVRHIYEKIGLSTRAGAALFAMENDLIHK
jgi:HD-GYP domain-containing protein (c-di-GMP phosphodiesterase class II)